MYGDFVSTLPYSAERVWTHLSLVIIPFYLPSEIIKSQVHSTQWVLWCVTNRLLLKSLTLSWQTSYMCPRFGSMIQIIIYERYFSVTLNADSTHSSLSHTHTDTVSPPLTLTSFVSSFPFLFSLLSPLSLICSPLFSPLIFFLFCILLFYFIFISSLVSSFPFSPSPYSSLHSFSLLFSPPSPPLIFNFSISALSLFPPPLSFLTCLLHEWKHRQNQSTSNFKLKLHTAAAFKSRNISEGALTVVEFFMDL